MSPQPDREFKEKLLVSGVLIFAIAGVLYVPLIAIMDYLHHARPLDDGTLFPILCSIPLLLGIGYRLSKCSWSWGKIYISSMLLGISLPLSSLLGMNQKWGYWVSPVMFSLFFLLCARLTPTDSLE